MFVDVSECFVGNIGTELLKREKEQQKTNKSSVVSGMFNSILRKIKGR